MNEKQAVAGHYGFGQTITALEVIDEDRLLVRTVGQDYVIIGNPADGGRIVPYTDDIDDDVKPDIIIGD